MPEISFAGGRDLSMLATPRNSLPKVRNSAAGCASDVCNVQQVLLSLDCGDDWADNPVVSRSWAISWDFKEAFDEAFEVRPETNCLTIRQFLERHSL